MRQRMRHDQLCSSATCEVLVPVRFVGGGALLENHPSGPIAVVTDTAFCRTAVRCRSMRSTIRPICEDRNNGLILYAEPSWRVLVPAT